MSSEKKMITLKSADGEIFAVEEAVAAQSETMLLLIQDNSADSIIPISNVSARVLSKVIEYCRKHVEAGNDAEAIEAWDKDFLKVDQPMLFGIIMAANYLKIKPLYGLSCQAVADMMKGKSPEDIRATFNIRNDFTPEEEEQVRKEVGLK
ncbi:hypothetical protein L6164_031171 [Bauhinia variegata]|uniref:Uncharacterized protein n=1 Tax=Bauhinia variegata TaxID=167791 RepID=A0ACB9LFX9_BAUVA|nr:hypothetical protein L6164_031171 [Bauhinia variegata]